MPSPPPSEAGPTSMPSLPPPPPNMNGPPPPPPPMDYRYGPPPPGYPYDPYYDMRYDPYGPPPPPHGPPPPGPHGPPPRYSPEYHRNRYAYPPPPRVSPRSMYGNRPPPPPHYMRGPPHGRMPPRRPSPIQTKDDGSTGSDKENCKLDSGKKIDGDGKDNGDLAVAVTASGSEDKGEKTPGKGGFMEAAVDNIIAAAEQIEKRDTPPSCPAEKKGEDESPAQAPGSANETDKSNASSAAPSPTDPQSSPPPPSFHRYSTSPVMNHPPQTLSHPHPMGPPGHGPPPPGPHGPPPPGPHGPPPHGPPPPGYNYDPYYDYRYDYYDSYYPPPPPYDHPPHCQCQYCSPAKRRAPSYPPPPPSWDYDYNLDLSSPDEPPTKKRRHEKRLYNTYSNATKHKVHTRNLDPAQEEAEAEHVKKLAKEVENDQALYRAVLLHMALEKESPKKKGSFDVEEVLGGFAQPSAGGSLAGSPNSMDLPSPHGFGVENRGMIGEGFYWKDYPLLENVLRKSMDEYYEMSENCPQSKQQQQFNNRLVSKVYHTAIAYGYTFDPIAYTGGSTPLTERKKSKQKDPNHDFEPLPPGFNYKKLRDRIRCYYKTHVQNSKKRLTTMLKNPTKPKNREILLRVVAEVKSEGYVGPLSGHWDGPKTKKTKSKVTASVTFSSDDDFGLGSFSADSHSPTEAERVMVESTNHQASPFRRMEHAQILSSMKDQVSL